MEYWQRKLLARTVGYLLATALTLASFFWIIALLWPRFGPAAVLLAALESWLLCFMWVPLVVKLEMWISRPRPVYAWQMKGLAEMAADDARRRARRQRYRRMFTWKRAG